MGSGWSGPLHALSRRDAPWSSMIEALASVMVASTSSPEFRGGGVFRDTTFPTSSGTGGGAEREPLSTSSAGRDVPSKVSSEGWPRKWLHHEKKQSIYILRGTAER